MIESVKDGDFVDLIGALVASVPTLFPNRKISKTRMMFNALYDGKYFMCSVWGKTALTLCSYLDKGHSVHIHGRVYAVRRTTVPTFNINRPQAEEMLNVDRVMMTTPSAQRREFKVEKPKVWSVLSKIPIVSCFVPEQMRL